MIPLRDANPSTTPQIVTVGLIILNVIMWLYEVSLDPSWLLGPIPSDNFQLFVHNYGFIPARFFGSMGPTSGIWSDTVAPLFASIFMHGSWMHLIGNMWFLWLFGDNVEDRMGHVGFLLFYLLCGIGATFAHTLFNPSSPVPIVGASGAISGVMGAYIILYPRAQILTLVLLLRFVRVVSIHAWVFLGVWIGFQVIMGAFHIGKTQGAGVAYWAHIGGFAIGAVLLFLFLLPKRDKIRETPKYRY